jgi:hypothetical protein
MEGKQQINEWIQKRAVPREERDPTAPRLPYLTRVWLCSRMNCAT